MLRKPFLSTWLAIPVLIFALAAPLVSADEFGGQGDLLKEVKKRGFIRCGVNIHMPGFAEQLNSVWKGHDVDYCRAVAAAIFGNETAVNFLSTTASNRFELLRDGDVDLLVRNTTITLTRDSSDDFGGESVDFAPVIFYDGQGFLTDVEGDITTADELADALNGKTVCVDLGTTTLDNLLDFAAEKDINITTISPQAPYTIIDLYSNGDCEFATIDQSILIASLPILDRPNSKVVPVIISKEPLAPVVRMGGKSERFEDVVRWVVYATFFAEEREITKINVDYKRSHSSELNSEEKRLLGIEGDLGVKLGLDNDWAYNVIKEVGNHRDIFELNLPGLEPGLNQPPPEGLLFSPPFR